MKIDKNTFAEINRPMYVLDEARLRRNLTLIRRVAQSAGVEIILAFKAYALWKTFPIFREYITSTTASSLAEALMAVEKFGSKAHTYSPAYTDYEIDGIAERSSHLTFNSLSQYEHYAGRVKANHPDLSIGLRINPEYSEIETDIYNPCARGARFGVTARQLPQSLPPFVEGFHCHCHCESSAETFVRTLARIEERFSRWFPKLKWINFGGGHLMTREGYNVDLLVQTLRGFRSRYPWLKVILEPGSAFAWQTGELVSQVADVVENGGIRTAILNVSFTCHMPDCLEMPYTPAVRGAETVEPDVAESGGCATENVYRLGGNSCLSGDFMGYWRFSHPLRTGENIIFEDMMHYTTVKTNTFNGVSHPAIAVVRSDTGELEILREYSCEDYLSRMD